MTRKYRGSTVSWQVIKAVNFHSPVKRVDLSRALDMKKPNVTKILKPLLLKGVLKEADPGNIRSRIILGDKYYTVCFYIKKDEIIVAKILLDGQICDERIIALEDTAVENIVCCISEEINRLTSWNPDVLLGIGIATLGQIDPVNGIVLTSFGLGWNNVNLKELLHENLNVPLIVQNHTRCEMRYFNWFEKYQLKYNNIFYLSIRDGLGCSVSIDGNVLDGGQYLAGEIGHIQCGSQGNICHCGKRDCLETYCSLTGIFHEMVGVIPELSIYNNFYEIEDLAKYSQVLENIINRAAEKLLEVVFPILIAIDPERILISADQTDISSLYAKHFKRHLHSKTVGLRNVDMLVESEDFSNSMVLKGVAAYVIEEAF